MSSPSVSAIVLVGEHAAHLERSVRSLHAQSYKGDLEIIIVDGRREGGTAREASAGAAVTLIAGVEDAQALDAGCTAALGEVLLILPAGDIASETRAARHVEALAQGDAAVSISYPALMDNEERRLIADCAPAFFPPAGPMVALEAFRRLFYGEDFVCIATAAFRRSLYEAVGPVLRSGVAPALREHDFWLRAAGAGADFHISNDPLSQHRLHPLAPRRRNTSAVSPEARVAMLRDAIGSLSDENVATLYEAVVAPPPLRADRAMLAPFLCLKHSDPQIREHGLQSLSDLLAQAAVAELMHDLFGLRAQDVLARLTGTAEQSASAHQ